MGLPESSGRSVKLYGSIRKVGLRSDPHASLTIYPSFKPTFLAHFRPYPLLLWLRNPLCQSKSVQAYQEMLKNFGPRESLSSLTAGFSGEGKRIGVNGGGHSGLKRPADLSPLAVAV